jgi:hypothetical protein
VSDNSPGSGCARVVHVATVHWKSARWIDLQRRYLDRYLGSPYRIYAFLNDVPGDHRDAFFYSSKERIKDHATKLNLLCDVIRFAGDPDDVLLVLDGDAFPVAPISPLLEERLAQHRLIAVQRLENNGDPQPHPCFCATTVGFWTQVGGDWHNGYEWAGRGGEPVTDVGANLLEALEREGVDWYPLRRVNRVNLHPLFFALYGDEEQRPLVYHHGGGFRAGSGRVTLALAGEDALRESRRARLFDRLPRKGPLGALRRRYHPVKQLRQRLAAETTQASQRMFARIQHDDEFWRELT